MALSNRVDPFGSLFATSQRGSLLGNRGGRFHHPESRTVRGRPYASKQWICCRLSFKNRCRTVWSKGYTELFFSDEHAALAAGHRPCFECRREDAVAFSAAWGRATGLPPPRAPEMDRILHAERLEGHAKRSHSVAAKALPDGALIDQDGQAWLVRGNNILLWTFGGYTVQRPFRRVGKVTVLTPPSILACLSMGYKPSYLQ